MGTDKKKSQLRCKVCRDKTKKFANQQVLFSEMEKHGWKKDGDKIVCNKCVNREG